MDLLIISSLTITRLEAARPRFSPWALETELRSSCLQVITSMYFINQAIFLALLEYLLYNEKLLLV